MLQSRGRYCYLLHPISERAARPVEKPWGVGAAIARGRSRRTVESMVSWVFSMDRMMVRVSMYKEPRYQTV